MNSRKINVSKRKSAGEKRFSLRLLIIVVAVVVLAIAVVGYFILRDRVSDEKGSRETGGEYAAVSEDLGVERDSMDADELVKDYGKHYDAAIVDLQSSEPRKWSADDVEKAFFCLIYAEKAGDFAQAQSIAYMIEDAESSGIDVNENTLGVTSEERAAILERAVDASSVRVTDGE